MFEICWERVITHHEWLKILENEWLQMNKKRCWDRQDTSTNKTTRPSIFQNRKWGEMKCGKFLIFLLKVDEWHVHSWKEILLRFDHRLLLFFCLGPPVQKLRGWLWISNAGRRGRWLIGDHFRVDYHQWFRSTALLIELQFQGVEGAQANTGGRSLLSS